MVVRFSSLSERLHGSLFFVPTVFVVTAALLGLAGVHLDRELVQSQTDLPFVLTSTVDSARSVLQTVGAATITFAGIAFSISLLVIQLASSQYSPRVVHGLLRDPFTKRIMGVVVGTFTFCLVVLRSVRGPLEEQGTPVIPNLSIAVAVVLGVVSILATIAFIDHSAHWMDVSRILARASKDGVDTVRRLWDGEPAGAPPAAAPSEPPANHLLVTHARDGWIRQIDLEAIACAAPPGRTVQLETEVGRYAIAGTPLCRVWPVPDDVDATRRRAREAVLTGRSRTLEQDVGYGVRQLADVALRGLSPALNDPTTAQDAMFHAGTILQEVVARRPPAVASSMEEGRVLVRPERLGHVDLIHLTFDEVRLAAVGMPTMSTYLLELLHLLHGVAGAAGSTEAVDAIRLQAALIRAAADQADLGAHDADRIRTAHDRRFGSPP